MLFRSEGKANLAEKSKNYFVLTPDEDMLAFSCLFTPNFQGTVFESEPPVYACLLYTSNQILEVGLNEELVTLFSRALEIADADTISSQQYLSGIVSVSYTHLDVYKSQLLHWIQVTSTRLKALRTNCLLYYYSFRKSCCM